LAKVFQIHSVVGFLTALFIPSSLKVLVVRIELFDDNISIFLLARGKQM